MSNEQEEMLKRLRSSVSQMNTTGRSRATAAPLDGQEEVVMGGGIGAGATPSPANAEGATSRRRPRRRPGNEEAAAPLPMDEDEAPAAPVVTELPAAAPAAPGPDATKLKDEIASLKKAKEALETQNKDLENQLKQVKEELEESQESVSVFEDLMQSYSKKEDIDVQEFADMIGEWKAKSKAFEPGQKAMEENKTLQKQVAELKANLEAEKKNLAEAQEKAKKLAEQKPAVVAAAAVPAAPAVDPKAAAASAAAINEWKGKYEQAIKDLDAVKAKVAGLESDVKAKEGEISDLKSRLQVALASASSGEAPTADDDPLIQMVEKLMKEMEAMVKENEEYMAKLEDDSFSTPTTADKQAETAKPAEEMPKAAEVSAAKPPAEEKPKAATNAGVKEPAKAAAPGPQPQKKK